MNLAIITLVGNNNYGNRLQNFALQEILKNKFQANVDNLSFSDRFFYEKPRNDKPFLLQIAFKALNFKKILSRKKQVKIKNKVFLPFKEKNFHYVDVREDNIEEIVNYYDYFIIGSDQVWNPLYVDGNKSMFATFAPYNKVLSYAASFGLSVIPDRFEMFLKEGLKNVSKISVREQEGIQIVEKIVNRHAELVLDPTMLLTGKQWHNIVENTSLPFEATRPYVVIYLLGDLTQRNSRLISDFVDTHNFEKYIIMGEKALAEAIVPNPLEFVKLIENAKFVFTDSFHATVFSILMNTRFKVFSRNEGEMNSRITTLLTNVGLSKTLIYTENIDKIFNELSLNYVEERLEKLRINSLTFLEDAIK